ncbi:MAG: acyltransferase family protein [Stellaceae bacterium]
MPALTSLRGLAAVTVLLYHCSYIAFNFAGAAQPVLWRRGYLAVDLFFLLSGFVLTHVYAGRFASERNWQTIGRFLWARICRIYPTSLFAAAVFVLPALVGRARWPAAISFKAQLIASLFLMQVPWLDKIAVNSPSWSVSAEFYAYLLFPFIVPVIWRLNGRAAAVLGIALLVAIAGDHMFFTHEQQDLGWGALLRALPEFTAGIFAYRLYTAPVFRTIWQKDAVLIAVAAAIIAACAGGASDGVIVSLLLPLLLAAVCNAGRIARLLDARPLRWLGEISYSLYIFQAMPLMLAIGLAGLLETHGLGGTWFLGLAALLALGSGVLVHRCVDVPVRAVLRRLPDRIVAVAAAYRGANIRPVCRDAGAEAQPARVGRPEAPAAKARMSP